MNLELESWKIKESCMRYNYKKMNYILTSSTMQYFLHFMLLSGAFFIIYLFDNLLDYSVTLLASCPPAVSGQRLQCQAGVNILLKMRKKICLKFEVFPPCIIFSPARQVCGCESSSDLLISPEQCSGQCRGQTENWKYLHKNLSTNLLWLLYLLSHCVIFELPLPCVYKFIYNS